MSRDALPSRFDAAAGKSLDSDYSAAGGGRPLVSAVTGADTTPSPSSPATSSSVCGDAGVVHRHEGQRDALVLVGGIGAGAEPVPVGEVGRRGPHLLAVE